MTTASNKRISVFSRMEKAITAKPEEVVIPNSNSLSPKANSEEIKSRVVRKRRNNGLTREGWFFYLKATQPATGPIPIMDEWIEKSMREGLYRGEEGGLRKAALKKGAELKISKTQITRRYFYTEVGWKLYIARKRRRRQERMRHEQGRQRRNWRSV